jgi:hypothetical protein
MITDPLVLAVWHAMDVCSELAEAHVGEPVLVSDMFKTMRWPAWPIGAGDAVVDLVVLTDGVMVVAEIRGRSVLRAAHVPYPTVSEVLTDPDPIAVLSRRWREQVDGVLTTALASLPDCGQALAGP